jgi:hypothetical protein
MLSRKAVAPPWATDDFSSIVGNPADSFGKVTSRRFTSNVPLSSGSPGDFQTWTTGAHQSEEDSWKLRNQPLPELYGGLGKTSHENERISNPKVYRKATPSLDANPYEGALGEERWNSKKKFMFPITFFAGPSIIESRQTSSSHARSQISALVKTPPDVWKKGKAPTIPFSGPLPGETGEALVRSAVLNTLVRGNPFKYLTIILRRKQFCDPSKSTYTWPHPGTQAGCVLRARCGLH